MDIDGSVSKKTSAAYFVVTMRKVLRAVISSERHLGVHGVGDRAL